MSVLDVLRTVFIPGPDLPNRWEIERSEVKLCATVDVRRRMRDRPPEDVVHVSTSVVNARRFLEAHHLTASECEAIVVEIANDLGIDPGRLVP